MTIWQPPRLDHAPGVPRYRAIADALAHDIARGALAAGSRLPTHRELATQVGVTVGTVSRAYEELARLGLTRGEVGRGTFVSQSEREPEMHAPGARVDLSRNVPCAERLTAPLQRGLAELARGSALGALLDYAPAAGHAHHREAGAAWLCGGGLATEPEQVVVTSGAQHAMLVALTAVAQPGDRVLAGALTYPGAIALAAQLRLRLEGVALDDEGIVPEALEAACRRGPAPRALYCMPNAQNPTAVAMGEQRRQDVAELARRYDFALIEDDIFGFLAKRTPLAQLAPERSYYVTSLSKCIAPGLRVGYLRAPTALTEAAASCVRTTMWMAPPLVSELATRWIHDGTASAIAVARQREAAERAARVAHALSHWNCHAPRDAYHAWLSLPEPWRAEAFCDAARQRGVALMAAERFATGRTAAPHAVRICAMAARDESDLDRALSELAALLEHPPAPAGGVV